MLENLTLDTFTPLLEQEFRIQAGDLGLTAILREARALGAPPSEEGRRQAWSLLFGVAEQHAVLEQAIYTVSHPALGELALFLVPVGPWGEGMQYEAVFT